MEEKSLQVVAQLLFVCMFYAQTASTLHVLFVVYLICHRKIYLHT